METSRVIIKNIPNNILSKEQLSSHFEKVCYSSNEEPFRLTDARVMLNKEKKSRGFAFIGFKNNKEANRFVNFFNSTYFNSRKISVELAVDITKNNEVKSYSKKVLKKRAENEKKESSKEATVVPILKAGGKGIRTHLNFGEDDEEDDDFAPGFEDELDDEKEIDNEKDVHDEKDIEENETVEKEIDNKKPQSASDDQKNNNEIHSAEDSSVLIENIPYNTNSNELKEYIESLIGPISRIDFIRNGGAVIIDFVFVGHLKSAPMILDNSTIFGRVCRAKFIGKKKQVESKKKSSIGKEHQRHPLSFNLLYVSTRDAQFSAAKLLGIDSATFDTTLNTGVSSAVATAIAETEVIDQTKQWLSDNHIKMEYFDRKTHVTNLKNKSLLARELVVNEEFSKNNNNNHDDSRTCIIKHLPVNHVEYSDLFDRLRSFGDIETFLLSPTKTIGICTFMTIDSCNNCVRKLHLRRYHHSPLLIEKVSNEDEIFTKKKRKAIDSEDKTDSIDKERSSQQLDFIYKETTPQQKESLVELSIKNSSQIDSNNLSLFISNLSWDIKTNEDFLNQMKSSILDHINLPINTITTRLIMNKLKPELPVGYGFISFKKEEDLQRFLKYVIDHKIKVYGKEIKVDYCKTDSIENENNTKITERRKATNLKSGATFSTMVTCKNLSFSLTPKELTQLFASRGLRVVNCRFPKKVGADFKNKSDGLHRGFGFVEFASVDDAIEAIEKFGNTHLYGRKLVLEPAKK